MQKIRKQNLFTMLTSWETIIFIYNENSVRLNYNTAEDLVLPTRTSVNHYTHLY